MIYLISFGGTRPNRITEKKDEAYHSRYARFCAYNANNQLHQDYLKKIEINEKFYTNDQWIDEEDLEEFLKDDTGEMRNRIKVVHNVIRPMVEQYRGNAIRMEYNAAVKSFSKKAINRREIAFAERMLHYDMSQQVPSLKPMIQRRFGVGDTPEETASIFENTYVDEYIEVINNLVQYVSHRCDFDLIKSEAAMPLAMAGIAITKNFEHANHLEFKQIDPKYFVWDRSGKKPDLSDASFWGETIPMEVTDILESNQDINPKIAEALEKWSTANIMNFGNINSQSLFTTSTTKVPTFLMYWKDMEKLEYGYVKDEFDYPYLTKINFTYPGEEKPRYTDKDLISVEPRKQKKILGGKLKKAIIVDVIRYCHFVPMEVVAVDGNEYKEDVVLDYGIWPYQENDNEDFHSAKPPYSIYTWAYMNGQVISPLEDAINPQRLINRMLSVAENQINNSRGSGTIIDKSMFEKQGEQAEALRAMNQSRPVFVDARGRGLQNTVASYDGTIKAGTQALFNIIDTFSSYIQKTSGVNDPMQGQGTGADQLVGVTQLMIQRGSLIQEPFYFALSEMMRQVYQKVITDGKNIYADNERELAIAVGDSGARTIKISRDMKTEDFRLFIKRENVDETLTSFANTQLLQLKELGMIDDLRFADLWNRSTPEQVSRAIRAFAKEKIEMQRQSAKNQAAMAENVNQKMAQQAELGVAQEEKQHLNNMESQTQAEKAKADTILLQNAGKEKTAMISKDRANLDNK